MKTSSYFVSINKGPLFRTAAGTAGCVILMALTLSAPSLVASQPLKVPSTATTTTVKFVGTVNVSDIARTAAATRPPASISAPPAAHAALNAFPVRRPPIKNAGAKVYSPVTATPLADGTSSAIGTVLFRGFTGLKHLDQRNADNGNQYSLEPPDQALAVGNGFVVESINNAINIYDTNGVQLLAQPLSLTEFFGLPPEIIRPSGPYGNIPGDPVALYDTETSRWFVEAWSQNVVPATGAGKNNSTAYLAVSTTSDPTGTWYVFNIGFLKVIPDYAKIGVDHNGLYFSCNEYKISNGAFLEALLLGARKSDLEAGISTPAFIYALPFVTGYEFTVHPASLPPGTSPVMSNGGTMYFVSSQFVYDTETSLAVWALINTSALNSYSAPTLIAATVDTDPYNYPTQAVVQQDGFRPLGASLGEPVSTLDPGDFRIQSVTFTNSQLFAALPTEVTDGNGDQQMAGAWFVLHPTISPGGTLSVTKTAQGVIAVDGASLLRPALAMNTELNGAMVFTMVGPNDYPSSAFVPFFTYTPGSIQLARAGNEPEDGFTGYPEYFGSSTSRWGDYSWAAVNDDGSIWTGTEYIPDIARTSIANWATYITRVQLNHN